MTKQESEMEELKLKIREGEAQIDKLYRGTCSDLKLARAHSYLDNLYLDYRDLMAKRRGENESPKKH